MAQILLTPFSGLFFHGVLAVILSATLGITFYRLRTRSHPLAFYLIGAGLALLHLILAGTFALSTAPEPSSFVAALERLAALGGLLWFAWLALRAEWRRPADTGLGVLLSLAAIGLGIAGFSPQVSGVPFNQTLTDAIWTWTGLILSVAAAAIARPSSPRRLVWSAGFGLLAIGFALHLAVGPTGESLPAFVRLGAVMAYPVLGAAFLLTSPSAEPEPPSAGKDPPSVREEIRPAALLEMAGLLLAENADDLAVRSVRALARAVPADICLLLNPADDAGRFSIAFGYDLIQEESLPGQAMDTQRLPVIGEALRQRRPAALPARTRSPDMAALQAALRLRSIGPIFFAPLECDGESLGGFLLLSPYSTGEWSKVQRQTVLSITPILARKMRALRTSASPVPVAAGPGEAPPAEEVRPLSDAQLEPAPEPEPPEEAQAVALEERPGPRTRLGAAVAAGQQSTESGQFQKLAVDLQIALRELAEARSKVQAADEAAPSPSGVAPSPSQAETIAGVSRSLREPMMSVVGYTDLLLGESVGLLGQMQRKFLERIRAGLRRSEELLNQLAELSAGNDRPAHATRPVDLRKAFDEAMERMAGSIRTRGQSVLGELPPDLPLVRAEENALLQILVHLLTNASGVTPPAGQIVVRSATHPAPSPAFVQLSIQDGGSGIPAPDLMRVFHAQQRDGVRIPGIAEEGADLAMVRALTETVGGRVWLESEVGRGTTISVLLPMAEATPEPAAGPTAEKPITEQNEPPERSSV